MTTRKPPPAKTHGQPWPIGAFFLTWATNESGERSINHQGRVLAFDGTTVWGELYSWSDGVGNGIRAIAFDADAITFYTTDREMREASFEYNRYRLHYIGTFEENEFFPAPPMPWTTPLPAGFESDAI